MKTKITTIAFLVLLLTACTLGPRYDLQTDQGVTLMQQHSEALFLSLENNAGKPAAAYTNYTLQYQQLHIDIQQLKTRAGAIPNDGITLKQLDLVDQNLTLLETI